MGQGRHGAGSMEGEEGGHKYKIHTVCVGRKRCGENKGAKGGGKGMGMNKPTRWGGRTIKYKGVGAK